MSDKGKQWTAEIRELADEQTGAKVWQITGDPSINHGLYYLTNPFLPDEESLVFASFRSGLPNFCRAGFPSGPITQLTDSPNINSFSARISHDGERLFFTRGSQVITLRFDDLSEEVLADFPGGKLGEINVSPDGQWLVTALRMGQRFGIALTATNGSGGGIIHHQDRTILHPQFHPYDAGLIEYASDPAPRMHLIHRDGSGNRCLYENPRDEFVVHETWLGDTGDLVFVVWPHAIKRINLASGAINTIAELNAWHITASADGAHILCDTNQPDIGLQLVKADGGTRQTVCFPASSNQGPQWAKSTYATEAELAAATKASGGAVWSDMQADTVYGPQWTHPHPALSDSGRFACFTSDRTGQPQVYVVQLPVEV